MMDRRRVMPGVRDWLAYAVVGCGGLAFAWFRAFRGDPDVAWGSGFLVGLVGGFVSLALLELSRRGGPRSGTFRWGAVLSSPLIGIPIWFVSPQFALAYFPGYAATFLLASAILGALHGSQSYYDDP